MKNSKLVISVVVIVLTVVCAVTVVGISYRHAIGGKMPEQIITPIVASPDDAENEGTPTKTAITPDLPATPDLLATPVGEEELTSERGNTSGNIANGGRVAQ